MCVLPHTVGMRFQRGQHACRQGHRREQQLQLCGRGCDVALLRAGCFCWPCRDEQHLLQAGPCLQQVLLFLGCYLCVVLADPL